MNTSTSSDRVRAGSTWKERGAVGREARVVEREAFGRYAVIENLETGTRTRLLIATLVQKWEPTAVVDPEALYICPKCGKTARPFGDQAVTWNPKLGVFFHASHRVA